VGGKMGYLAQIAGQIPLKTAFIGDFKEMRSDTCMESVIMIISRLNREMKCT
jgi:hypothetical protein